MHFNLYLNIMTQKNNKKKQWPDDGSPAHADDILSPLVEAINFAYSLERQNKGKDIPWNGLEIGEREQSTSLLNASALSGEELRYQEECQARTALLQILGIALRLGIEQGRRIHKKELQMNVELKSMQLGSIRKEISEIENWLNNEIISTKKE